MGEQAQGLAFGGLVGRKRFAVPFGRETFGGDDVGQFGIGGLSDGPAQRDGCGYTVGQIGLL
jgi:hypothetical protein